MDQHIDNSRNEFLWSLLADPANDARLYAYNLQRLVDDFPQSGILQALLAHASDDKNLKRASVYFDSKSLFKLINAPSTLRSVSDERIVKLTGAMLNGHSQYGETTTPEQELTLPEDQPVDIDPHGSNSYFSEHSGVDVDAEMPLLAEDNTPLPVPEAEFHSANDQTEELHTTGDTVVIADAVAEDDSSAAVDAHESPTLELQDEEPAVENKEHAEQPGDQNSELSGADVTAHEEVSEAETNPQDNTAEVEISEQPVVENDEPAAPKETPGDKFQMPALHDEADKLIVGNIAATDFFMFDRAFGEKRETGKNLPAATVNSSAETGETAAASAQSAAHSDLSKYNDDKMPYTFMWWLDKTRKEHAGINQPYIKPDAPTSVTKTKNVTDELQQQYFENIFHITSVDELDKHTTPKVFNFGVKPKEQVIIERFIKEEPQIKPQSGDKLDNENKAKKSSEDRDELVTETLAAIYVDQMLYHKAIASYKKLILKYPEKSRYFAAKIEQLEKKTN